MIVLEWARFLIGGGLLLCGLGTFIIEIIGVFRFRYVLNRMHAAAIGDTLGIGFALLGLIVISGFNFTSLKLFLVIVFLWFSSPVSSHLIARLEVSTNEDSGRHYRVMRLDSSGNGARESEEGTEGTRDGRKPVGAGLAGTESAGAGYGGPSGGVNGQKRAEEPESQAQNA